MPRCCSVVFLLMLRHPPPSTLFPYTTLFRSAVPPPAPEEPAPLAPGGSSTTEAPPADVFGGTSSPDRKSTRLNSSHQIISYAVFCLKKKKQASSSARCTRLPCPNQLPLVRAPPCPARLPGRGPDASDLDAAVLLRCLFVNAPAPTAIYTLSLHDALPICRPAAGARRARAACAGWLVDDRGAARGRVRRDFVTRSEEHTSELQSPDHLVCRLLLEKKKASLQ